MYRRTLCGAGINPDMANAQNGTSNAMYSNIIIPFNPLSSFFLLRKKTTSAGTISATKPRQLSYSGTYEFDINPANIFPGLEI